MAIPQAPCRSCQAILNDGNALRDMPTLIGQLVHIAIQAIAVGQLERVLAQGEPPEALLAALQARLEEEAEVPVLLIGVRGERAGVDRFLQALQNGTASLSTLGLAGLTSGPPGSTGKLDSLMGKFSLYIPGTVAHNRAAALQWMNRAVEICKLPPEAQADAFKELEAARPQQPVLARALVFSSANVVSAANRQRAGLRRAAVALAVERFRRQHGRWADQLSDLVPAFLHAVPTDPFDGAPLRYRHDKEGVVIYSVGPDGKDNGGAFDTLNTRKDGTDLGFRLWDVPGRGCK